MTDVGLILFFFGSSFPDIYLLKLVLELKGTACL